MGKKMKKGRRGGKRDLAPNEKRKKSKRKSAEDKSLQDDVRKFLQSPLNGVDAGERKGGAEARKRDPEMARRLKEMHSATTVKSGTKEVVSNDAIDRDERPWWERTKKLPSMGGKGKRKGRRSTTESNSEEVDRLWARAEELWIAGESASQNATASANDADAKFLREVMQAGTLSDRVAALTLVVQREPLYSLTTLQKLTDMAAKQGQRSTILAIEALKDLYVENILPPRRLVEFQSQPLEHPETTDAHLIAWYFEAEVKRLFAQLVNALEKTSFDNLEHFKLVAIRSAHAILSEKPEGEARLLSILVNKLGDPHRKVAAKTMHLLQQLSAKHPNMQSIIVREIKQFMHRPNVSDAAQYYSILFLNQIFFRRSDGELARQVVLFYFDVFKRYIGEVNASDKNVSSGEKKKNARKGDEKLSKKQRKQRKRRLREDKVSVQNRARHLSALLTGVNRAFPYASELLMRKEERAAFDACLDMLFKLSHVAPLATSVQALTFLFQIVQADLASKTDASTRLQTRFYRALYQRLLTPELWSTRGRLKLVLNLIFRATKHDPSASRARAFLKRLLQVSAHGSPAMSCGALYLVSTILASRSAVRRRVENDEEKYEPYDPKKRTPLHAGAERESLWELVLCRAHYHPSVGAFCAQMQRRGGSSSASIEYEGDPLRDFSLVAFLNRFSYRNPKQHGDDNGDDDDGEGASSHAGKKVVGTEGGAPVNSNEFLKQPVGRVRPDEMFFYQFFSEKARRESLRPRHQQRTTDTQDEKDEEAAEEAFAQKLAESLMRDDGEDDVDFDFDMSSDEDAVLDGDDSEEDTEQDEMTMGDRSKTKKKDARLFAAAEEFAEILETAADGRSDGKSAKQVAWESGKLPKKNKRKSSTGQKGPRKRRGGRRA